MEKRYDWSDFREDAIERFRGELPHAQTEDEIITVFEQRPSVVLRAIEEVAEQVAQGKARSGWAVLRARVQGALEPLRDASAEGNEREGAVSRAEAWIRQAGLHFDRPEEVDEYLFGEDGMLRFWATDVALKRRLLEHWKQVRPAGIQLELDQTERLGRYRPDLERAAAILKARKGSFGGFVQPGEQVDEDEWATA